MPNPFRKEEKTPIDYELVGGSFSCERADCSECMKEARYYSVGKLLTWRCPQGHVSMIEDFRL